MYIYTSIQNNDMYRSWLPNKHSWCNENEWKKTRLKFECDANHEAGEIQYDFKTFKILHHFFPGLLFYVYIESPNPKNPEDPTPQAPNPTNWKLQPQKSNLKPYPQNPKPP